MAKTRSQTKRDNSSCLKVPSQPVKKLSKNLKRNKPKLNEIKVPQDFQICRVRLTKLTPDQIDFWLQGKSTDSSESVSKKIYELRTRPLPIIPVKRAEKSLKQLVVSSQMAFCTAKAIRIWENLKKQNAKNSIQLKVNQIVCARMSGHRPWPSKIVAIQKNGIKLTFFGTHDTGIVKKSEVIPYELCNDVLEQYLKVPVCDVSNNRINYHLSFIKACKETSCNGQTTKRANDS